MARTIDNLDLRSPQALELASLRERNALLEDAVAGARSGKLTMAQTPAQAAAQRAGRGSWRRFHQQKLYDAYLQVPWISGPIDTIANRMTSGGIDVVPLRKGANTAQREQILDVLHYCNRYDNVVSMAQRLIRAMFIFGEGMWELVYAGDLLFELYYADPITVQPQRDVKGDITGFVQYMESGDDIEIPIENILYVAQYGPRGEVQSPIEKLLSTTTVYNNMMRWNQMFFAQGAKPSYWIEMGPGSTRIDAERYIDFHDEQIAGVENGHRVDIAYGNMVLHEFSGGGKDFEFLNGIKFVREEFLTVLGVPASAANITDDGNRLTDVSEGQDKQFRFNTIDPARNLFEEAATYAICKVAMGIDDWAIKLCEKDYRGDDLIIKQVIEQVNSGLITRDEARPMVGHEGKVPNAAGGGSVAAISLTREVVPVSDLKQIHGSQFVQAQQQGIQQGLDPHTKPSHLATASPRDPLDSGDAHPVSVQDQREDQARQNPQEAVDDLKRWQRIATRCVRERRPQRSFVSEHLDAELLERIAEDLEDADTADAVRVVFDAAFRAVSEERA